MMTKSSNFYNNWTIKTSKKNKKIIITMSKSKQKKNSSIKKK